MNYYSHHIGDYRRDTMYLSLLEHGVYRQLLDMYYLSERPIPLETEVVFRRLRADTEQERQAVEFVLSEFFQKDETEDGGWRHRRCDAEIEAYQAKAERARSNGKLGGRPSKTKAVSSGNQKQSEKKANHKPITNNQEPIETTSCAAAPAEPGLSADPTGSDQPVAKPSIVDAPSAFTLPLNTGEEFPITVQRLAEFRMLYPAVDVDQALRSMRGWLIANPSKRKTKTGILRFVNNWLSKEQDGASARRGPSPAARSPGRPSINDFMCPPENYDDVFGEATP